MEGGDTVMSNKDWEAINQKAGVDVLDIVVNLDGRYTPGQQAELIVERCNLTAKAQAEISFKAGIMDGYSAGKLEGRREVVEEIIKDMNIPVRYKHNATCYDCMERMREKYIGKPNSKSGDYSQ